MMKKTWRSKISLDGPFKVKFYCYKTVLVRLQVLNKNSGFYENVTWLFFPGVETKLGVYLSVFYNELS